MRDVYGARRIVDAGVIPAVTVDEAEGLEPELAGRFPAFGPAVGVAGLDLVRERDGSFQVLEDNLRVPSGYAYAMAARDAVAGERLPGLPQEDFTAAAFAGLANTLLAAAPPDAGEPSVVVLTDGPENSAYHEHQRAARRLDIPLVTPDDLELRDGRLVRRDEHGRAEPVDVVYRRSDHDRLRGADGELTPLSELLLEPWLAGAVGIVNPYGTGVADDKAVHAHVEDMVRFYLREEPLLASVHTLDLADEGALDEALGRIDELVVKPRFGHGGHGIVVCAHATPEDVREIVEELKQNPTDYVVQPTVALSRHPTIVDGGTLAPAPRRPAPVRVLLAHPDRGAARRADPCRLRRGRAGRQLLAAGRRQGHAGRRRPAPARRLGDWPLSRILRLGGLSPLSAGTPRGSSSPRSTPRRRRARGSSGRRPASRRRRPPRA